MAGSLHLRPGGTALAPAAAPADDATRPECHFCSCVLPRGRSLTFCPYCGQNLNVRQCPACSAELDVEWRYCVCCGRGVQDPRAPAAEGGRG